MVEASDDPSITDKIKSKAHLLGLVLRHPRDIQQQEKNEITGKKASRPLSAKKNASFNKNEPSTAAFDGASINEKDVGITPIASGSSSGKNGLSANEKEGQHATSSQSQPSSPVATNADGQDSSVNQNEKSGHIKHFFLTIKGILFSSIINVLLIFVPAGIAVHFANINPTVVFALNAVAVIPLAGLLAHATEVVASSLGDTIGALLNVTFGNAVELIIFIIALVKNEISIVQASLVGSILSNLLLILGMCFFFGGLRFREQLYNSTVTQMSACLLSLAVVSLLLPTAFHASFTSTPTAVADADFKVLQVSRGTSVILLFVYILYILFQLKSHAYMYESTPQHIIDEESHPGVLADVFNSSSSEDDSSSTDSDSTESSHVTAKRIKRALRRRRHRKSSVSTSNPMSPRFSTRAGSFNSEVATNASIDDIMSTSDLHDNDADNEGEHVPQHIRDLRSFAPDSQSRDFELEHSIASPKLPELRIHPPSSSPVKLSKRKKSKTEPIPEEPAQPPMASIPLPAHREIPPATPKVAFDEAPKRPLAIRGLSVRPAMPKMLSSTVFSSANMTGVTPVNMPPVVPRAPYGLRRTNSLPEKLNQNWSSSTAQPIQRAAPGNVSTNAIIEEQAPVKKEELSRVGAILLLLISTGLVAVCAEFLVGSINQMVESTGVSETFIGLIVLPIVGNAAEHVTAVTVASKNKMDLAIGVAVGSSIQIALFVTPLVVLLGWIMSKDMSLYFTLFEVVSLFASAFIVNFLVLDGRSNYLEGALLMAAYLIIAVAAYFYPIAAEQSALGGTANATMAMRF